MLTTLRAASSAMGPAEPDVSAAAVDSQPAMAQFAPAESRSTPTRIRTAKPSPNKIAHSISFGTELLALCKLERTLALVGNLTSGPFASLRDYSFCPANCLSAHEPHGDLDCAGNPTIMRADEITFL